MGQSSELELGPDVPCLARSSCQQPWDSGRVTPFTYPGPGFSQPRPSMNLSPKCLGAWAPFVLCRPLGLIERKANL